MSEYDHPCRYPECKCDDCRWRATRRQKIYRMQRAQAERTGMTRPGEAVDARPYAKLVREALDRGMTQREIRRVTNTAASVVTKLVHYKRGDVIRYRIGVRIEAGLVDDEKRDLLENSWVPRAKSRQVVRSLIAQGFTVEHQQEIYARYLEGSNECVKTVIRSRGTRVLKQTENKILELARLIGDETGPAKSSITLMRNRGIFPNKHYGLKGDLIESTLSPEQRAALQRVQ